jgi:hypothetical protein
MLWNDIWWTHDLSNQRWPHERKLKWKVINQVWVYLKWMFVPRIGREWREWVLVSQGRTLFSSNLLWIKLTCCMWTQHWVNSPNWIPGECATCNVCKLSYICIYEPVWRKREFLILLDHTVLVAIMRAGMSRFSSRLRQIYFFFIFSRSLKRIYLGFSPRWQSCRSVKLATDIHLVSRLRMCGANLYSHMRAHLAFT